MVEAKVAAPVVEAPVEDDPPVPAGAGLALVEEVNPWLPMDEAPHDGTLVELQMHMMTTYARYRITRRRIGGRWVPVGFWSDPVTREELTGQPLGWRMPDGYLTPGMVV